MSWILGFSHARLNVFFKLGLPLSNVKLALPLTRDFFVLLYLLIVWLRSDALFGLQVLNKRLFNGYGSGKMLEFYRV